MDSLGIYFDSELTLARFKNPALDFFDRDGRRYGFRGPHHDDTIFYDWLFDSRDRIVGIEFHITNENVRHFTSDTRGLGYVEFNPFPQVWFTAERNGQGRGLEAFGDNSFFATETGQWLVLVGTEHWLSAEEAEQLWHLDARWEHFQRGAGS